MLAKALGRFYAAQIIRLKSSSSKRVSSNAAFDWQLEQTRKQNAMVDVSLAFDVTMLFKHIQVALESYEVKPSEKKSRNRTYLMDTRTIMLQQRSKGHQQFSRLTINELSIVQLSESKQSRRRVLRPGSEPQHQILERRKNAVEGSSDSHKISTTPLTLSTKTNYRPLIAPKELRLSFGQDEDKSTSRTEFIRACHYHDGDNHVDEVEVDIADVLIRVTPTCIVDLTKASIRLFELVQLTTKEMERKVHAGRRSKLREYNTALRSTKSLHDLEPPILSPPLSAADGEYNPGKCPTDSSIIYRVAFEGASLFVGRPAAEFTTSKRHGAAPHDYVIQVLTNASILVQSIENADSSGSKTAHLSLQDLSASISNTWATTTRIENKCLSPSEVDLRAVYKTVEEGFVVSQDFSFDCESLKFCMVSAVTRYRDVMVRST